MQLFVIGCFTRLKVLRFDLCLLFSGRRDLRPRHKNPVLVVSISRLHQIHAAVISVLIPFTIYSSSNAVTQIAGGEKTALVSLFNGGRIYSLRQTRLTRIEEKSRQAARKERKTWRRWLEQPAFYCMFRMLASGLRQADEEWRGGYRLMEVTST